jgi:hypothetical protein
MLRDNSSKCVDKNCEPQCESKREETITDLICRIGEMTTENLSRTYNIETKLIGDRPIEGSPKEAKEPYIENMLKDIIEILGCTLKSQEVILERL